MEIRTQVALLASIVATALGLSMLLRAGRARVQTLYSTFALSVGGFYLAQFVQTLVEASSSPAPWALRVVLGAKLISGALVPSSALAFFLEFLVVSPSAYRKGRRVAWLSGIFGLAVAVSPLAGNGWAQLGLGVWVFSALLISVSLVVGRMRQTDSRIERTRLAYLAIGAAASIFFAALDFAARLSPLVPTLGPVICALYLFFLAQTLLRLRLMDLHELLGKIASQSVLAAVLALVFTLLTIWVKGNVSLFLFNTMLAAFVMLTLLEPLRAKIDERVVAIFFRERFALLRSLSGLRARMNNVIDVNELTTLVLGALHETRRVTHTSIYLLAEDRPGFRLLDSRGPAPVPFLDTAAARGVLAAASSGQKAVLLENLERRIAELRARTAEGKKTRDEIKRLADTRQALLQMRSGISVPLISNDRVIGFMNLWDERVPEAYASDEIALVLDVAERLSMVIENSKLYDRMRERDRLAALGEMSAGLAHEIRNPLGAIKGAAQCLNPKGLTGEDQEFLGVIVEEVNRLNGVVTEFLDYARPLKQNFGPTDMNEVVTRTMRLIQNDIPATVEVTLELSESLPRVSADAEQLKQVLLNLIRNATQAMKAGPGKITLRTQGPDRFPDFRTGNDGVELHVTDTGPGIPDDQQPHIFVPFYTTKQEGTGLGLAICQRIVKSHGGAISVQSRGSEGTTFIVRLPAIASELPESFTLSDGTPLPDSLMVSSSNITGPLAVTAKLDPKGRRDRKKRRAG